MNTGFLRIDDLPEGHARFRCFGCGRKAALCYAAMKDLLLSGLLENGDPVAEHAAVVQAHFGRGDVLLFANNPVYRGETVGSYALIFNSIINFGHLK
jgi:hypothetical protein